MNDRTTYFSKKILLSNVIMTFSIVLLHSIPTIRCGFPFNFETSPFIFITFILTQVAVPFFFFISGMLFYRSCDYSNLLKKLKSRVFSLVIPYLLWCLITRLFYYSLTKVPYISDSLNYSYSITSFGEFVKDVLTGRYTDLWFVKYLIYYLVLSPIIVFVLKNIYLSLLTLLLIILAALSQNVSYWSLYTWLILYFIGALCGKFFYNKLNENVVLFANTNRGVKLFITISLTLIFITLIVLSILIDGFSRVYWIFSPFICWMLIDLLLEKYIKNSFVPKKWMTYTFFIFCSHHLVINILQKVVLHFIPHKMLYLNILFIVSPIVVILFLIAVANFLSRFSFYKYLSGGR